MRRQSIGSDFSSGSPLPVSATLLDGRGDERDHPFILGATNVALPSYKVGFLAIMKRFFELHGTGSIGSVAKAHFKNVEQARKGWKA